MTKELPITNSQVAPPAESDEERCWEEFTENTLCLREEFSPDQHPFDLQERTVRFGEQVIRFAKQVPQTPTTNRLIEQLVGAATSVGANYCEADEGISKKDFKKHIDICCKEAKETNFFLRMIAVAEENLKPQARELWKEARELHLIFCSIFRKC